MEMTEKPIKSLYLNYLVAAFGSALVGAVYILVDMAVIGQYAGPTGTADIAPAILRKYGMGYLFAPFTLFATYYFQSILKARTSVGISLSRGLIVGGVMLYVLPALFGADGSRINRKSGKKFVSGHMKPLENHV